MLEIKRKRLCRIYKTTKKTQENLRSIFKIHNYEPTSDRKQSLYIPSCLQAMAEVTQEELTSLQNVNLSS